MSEPGAVAGPRIIVALDYASPDEALILAGRLDPARCRVKVGKELFTRTGPAVVESLAQRGFDVFLDLKFHDIPNTVAGACRAAADLGVWMLNVHAAGGRAMLRAAREACDAATHAPLLIGVTLLTSLEEDDLRDVGMQPGVRAQVLRLARLAADSGLDGVVCSPADLGALAGEVPDRFLRVTPGVRPATSERGDQKRVATPREAVRAGAHYLVIGRPVTRAPDPLAALAAIEADLFAL
ncbi:MAG: orotidine-5'-phosphate decarboxylase [Gammaproteobacteria bacterium]|nr:orotidine-5'-phosphate decarboxylase [Gammaproteobacteria bacterium]